jgi:glutathione S-transferase
VIRLYTFAISHFSEKARWAFDWNRVTYDERRLVPGPHMAVTRRLAKGTSVPVLVHDGAVVQGSSAILDHLESSLDAKRLAPPEASRQRCREIEELADRAFGLGTQRVFYASLLEHRDAVVDMWSQGGPWWGRAFYRVAFGLVRRGTERMYRIRPDKIEASKDLFRRAFDELDRDLGGRRYLLGDAPSRADVTVASLLAPMCRPPEHLLRWPTSMPPDLGAFIGEFEGRPTWELVLRMYREHRRSS